MIDDWDRCAACGCSFATDPVDPGGRDGMCWECIAEGELVLCRCGGEKIAADRARRLGCDQSGGCPELRDAMEF